MIRKIVQLLPGIALAAGVMLLAGTLSGILGAWVLKMQGISPEGKASPISGIMVAIVFGMVLANTIGTGKWFAPGLDFSVKKILRLGIILVGIRLSFLEVLKLGAYGVPIVLTIIVLSICFTTWFARRLALSNRLGILAAAATSICGVTATVAVAPTIDAEDQEVSYTIANVTLFGILAMFSYPFLAHWIFDGESSSAGLFLGTSIHETAQVLGAAISYKEVFQDETVQNIATVTKLTRNLFLIAVVPSLAFYYMKKQGGQGKKVQVARLFPLFILGFLFLALLRSVGDAGIAGESHLAFGNWDKEAWKGLTKMIGDGLGYYALGTAMASVGLSTQFKKFKGLGLKPLYLGAVASLIVGVLALIFASVLGRFLV